MTRQEAIIILDTLWSNPLFNESHREALKIGAQAIKALEQESCEDAISRQNMLDIIEKILPKYVDLGCDIEDICLRLKGNVNILPPVVPTRRKGNWMANSDYPERLICNKCHVLLDMWYWESKPLHYCPNCGVDMREDE